ncbi:MAG: murein biosynthesis integral membrane protein MurJ, partial [Verrucomicrobiota bacterium]
ASIAVNAILNAFWVFVFEKGHEFLALSTTVSAILNFFVLYLVMLAMTKRLHTGDLFGTTFRVILAAAGLSAVCLFSRFTVLSNWQTQGFAWNALWLFSTIFLAGLGYFLLGRLLRLQELDQFSSLLMRKLRRS